MNNSKLEFWYCNCTSPEVFATRYRNTENRRSLGVSGPIALNSRKHKGGRRWRQLFRRRVAAPLPGSCIVATAGEIPMRETIRHKLIRFQTAFEKLMLKAYAMHAVARISHATVYCHKILHPFGTGWYWYVWSSTKKGVIPTVAGFYHIVFVNCFLSR